MLGRAPPQALTVGAAPPAAAPAGLRRRSFVTPARTEAGAAAAVREGAVEEGRPEVVWERGWVCGGAGSAARRQLALCPAYAGDDVELSESCMRRDIDSTIEHRSPAGGGGCCCCCCCRAEARAGAGVGAGSTGWKPYRKPTSNSGSGAVCGAEGWSGGEFGRAAPTSSYAASQPLLFAVCCTAS